MDNVNFIETVYDGANHPLYSSRSKELAAVKSYAEAYNRKIDEADFDTAIANRFNDGCEVEWTYA